MGLTINLDFSQLQKNYCSDFHPLLYGDLSSAGREIQQLLLQLRDFPFPLLSPELSHAPRAMAASLTLQQIHNYEYFQIGFLYQTLEESKI